MYIGIGTLLVIILLVVLLDLASCIQGLRHVSGTAA